MYDWLLDNWPWWIWIAFTVIWLGGYQIVAWRTGRPLLSWQVWNSTDRWLHLPYVALTPIVILVVHFWIVRARWGWGLGILLCVPLWWDYTRRRRRSIPPPGGSMPELTLAQRVKERPLWIPALAGVLAQLALAHGLELDQEWISIGLGLVVGLVTTLLQQRKVTSVAKIERLEEQGAIAANPKVAPSVVDVITTPPDKLPPSPAPFPTAKAFPGDPVDRRH